MIDEYSFDFSRLLHSLLRHGNSEKEKRRAAELVDWMSENLVRLRKVNLDVELEMIGIVWAFARDNGTLPTLDIVRDNMQKLDQSEGVFGLLDYYLSVRDTLTLYDPPELSQVLRDKTTEFENCKLEVQLKVAQRITSSSVLDKKSNRTLQGARDALNYLLKKMEEGILVDQQGTFRPIDVKKDATLIGADYDELKARGSMPTGFDDFPLYRSNFVGILGYSGGGKSTFARFLVYTMACAGYRALHISLENDSEIERNKYVLLHAHNPKFGGEFDGITYEKFKRGELNDAERRALDYIAEDFESTVSASIVIHQPQVASWEATRQIVEIQANKEPLDVLLIDYVQLMEPEASGADDVRAKMNAMVKSIRQFGLTFQPNRKLLILSPVQSNEEGKKYADVNDGIFTSQAINQHKELLRSMDVIVSVYDFREIIDGESRCMLASLKDRDGIGFPPTPYWLSKAGWVSSQPTRSNQPLDDCLDDQL